MNKIKITDTTLRDAHQSIWATRMHIEDMIPILDKLDNAGYHSLEVWGGATFDVCMRYLGEGPWERLRTIKKHVKKTPLQMLLRGQSLVGYQHYPDDVVDAFVTRAIANGIDIIRIFDALNDLRNMETAIKVAKREGAHVQGSVAYTVSPVHTLDHYLDTAIALQDMGVDSICIKDMAGLLTPYIAYDLVDLFKKNLHVPIQVHCHYIGGLAVGSYLKAAEAGAAIVDTASVPLAFGASQPPVETLVRALDGTPYDTGLNLEYLFEIARYFEDLRVKLGYERGVTRITDMMVFQHQVPGGMISNLVSQLREQRAEDRLEEVLEEIPKVRAELGYPPLVTPTSQIVGTQAVLNVLMGERYKMIPGEVKDYVKGLYGKAPGTITEAISKKIIGNDKVVSVRPADLLKPRMEKAKQEIGDLAKDIDDVLSYVLFPQVAKKYLSDRKKGLVVRENPMREKIAAEEMRREELKPSSEFMKGELDVNIKDIKEIIGTMDHSTLSQISIESDGIKLELKRGQDTVCSDSKKVSVSEKKAAVPLEEIEEMETVEVEGQAVVSPMVGTFYSAPSPDADPYVEVGDQVEKGQVLCIIEAMKLMNEVEAEVSGKIVQVLTENGQPVEYGQELFIIEEE